AHGHHAERRAAGAGLVGLGPRVNLLSRQWLPRFTGLEQKEPAEPFRPERHACEGARRYSTQAPSILNALRDTHARIVHTGPKLGPGTERRMQVAMMNVSSRAWGLSDERREGRSRPSSGRLWSSYVPWGTGWLHRNRSSL